MDHHLLILCRIQPREEAKWQFPTLDGAKNTVGGMSAAIENSIKDVER